MFQVVTMVKDSHPARAGEHNCPSPVSSELWSSNFSCLGRRAKEGAASPLYVEESPTGLAFPSPCLRGFSFAGGRASHFLPPCRLPPLDRGFPLTPTSFLSLNLGSLTSRLPSVHSLNPREGGVGNVSSSSGKCFHIKDHRA